MTIRLTKQRQLAETCPIQVKRQVKDKDRLNVVTDCGQLESAARMSSSTIGTAQKNHHTINSLKRRPKQQQQQQQQVADEDDKMKRAQIRLIGNQRSEQSDHTMRWPHLASHKLILLAILTLINATNCDVTCPKDLTPIYPCSCQNGTQALLIKCSRANLAILSNSLKYLRDPVEQVEIENCSASKLFGPLFADSLTYKFHSTIRELAIRASQVKSIDANSFSKELLTNLQYLTLDRNSLAQVPIELINNMTNLRLLNLSGNSMGSIESNSFSRLANLSELDLSANKISRLAKNSFASLSWLEILNLSSNEINKLEKNLFAFGRRLRVLDLSGNKLTSLDRQDFSELTQLETLRVANNQLSTLPRSIFSRNAKLYHLDLSLNKLEDIDTYLFKSVRFLKDLNISGNLIKEITKNTFSPTTRIKRINLANNQLQVLAPETFKGLEWLELIDLSHNQIVNISNDAFNRIYSVEIDLSFNKLTRVFYWAFHEVSNITKLNLSHNLIDEGISPIAFESTDCAQLDLSYNQIEDISKIPISNFTGIRTLDLRHNQITELNKKSFGQKVPLYELHTIDASFNNISQISGNILERLKSIRMLNISHNSLRRLTSGGLGNSPTLLELDLSSNNLVEVISGTLVGLVSMRNLDISYNRLKKMIPIPVALNSIHLEHNEIGQLSRSAFPSLNSLLELHLDHNRISNIDEGTFSTLLALHTLSLSYNNLSQVPASALRDLASLQMLRLDGNNIQRLARKAFGVLPIVFDLHLNHNNISHIADHAFDGLLQLLTLNLSHNQLAEIPPEAFASLVSLRNLDLSNNQLTRFENKTRSAMEDLLSLEVANLSSNKLSMVTQKTFLSSPYIPYKLTKLDLSNNLIGIMPNNFANGLKRVEWLSLRNNIINEIYPNVIGNASHLRFLDLSHNKLRTLKEGTFNGVFVNLTSVLLNNNKLTSFPLGREFDKLRALIQLDLSSNRLDSFPAESTRWIKRGLQLDLRNNNNLECTCNLLPLLAWVDSVRARNQTLQLNSDLASMAQQRNPAPNNGVSNGLLSPKLLAQYLQSAQLIAQTNCSRPELISGRPSMQMLELAEPLGCPRSLLEEADALRRLKAPIQFTGAEPFLVEGKQELRIGWNLIDPQIDLLNFVLIKSKFSQPIEMNLFRMNSAAAAATTTTIATAPKSQQQQVGANYQLLEQEVIRADYHERTLILRDLQPDAFYVICLTYETSDPLSSPASQMIDLQLSRKSAERQAAQAAFSSLMGDYLRVNCADLNLLLRRQDDTDLPSSNEQRDRDYIHNHNQQQQHDKDDDSTERLVSGARQAATVLSWPKLVVLLALQLILVAGCSSACQLVRKQSQRQAREPLSSPANLFQAGSR